MNLVDFTNKEIPEGMKKSGVVIVDASRVGLRISNEESEVNLRASIENNAPRDAKGYIIVGPSDPVAGTYCDSYPVNVEYVF